MRHLSSFLITLPSAVSPVMLWLLRSADGFTPSCAGTTSVRLTPATTRITGGPSKVSCRQKWATTTTTTPTTTALREFSLPDLPNPFSNLKVPKLPFLSSPDDEDDELSTIASAGAYSSFEYTPTGLIAQAKRVLATDLGLLDPSLLDDSQFQWVGPNVDKPLDKTGYLAAGRFFNIRGAFPDLDYRAHDFRLDDADPSTVRVTCRVVGTMRGSLRLRDAVLEPTGTIMKCPPEAISISIDPTSGKIRKLCTGFCLDRQVGNTAGTTGVMAAAYIGGQPISDWDLYPPASVIQRFFARPIQPIPEPVAYLAPFPETVMVQLAKGVLSSNMGAMDPSLLSSDFTFLTPTIGPIRKEEFVEKYARDEFDGIVDPGFSNFRVDPYDPNRVWVDIRPSAPTYEGAPQAMSFTFDDDGFCTRVTSWAVLDPTIGNGGGLGGPEGYKYALGRASLSLTTRPLPRILGRLGNSILEPITSPLADVSASIRSVTQKLEPTKPSVLSGPAAATAEPTTVKLPTVPSIPTLNPNSMPTLNIKSIPTLNIKSIPTLNIRSIPTLNIKSIPSLNILGTRPANQEDGTARTQKSRPVSSTVRRPTLSIGKATTTLDADSERVKRAAEQEAAASKRVAAAVEAAQRRAEAERRQAAELKEKQEAAARQAAKAAREQEEARKADAARQQKEINARKAADARALREREEARKAEAARQLKEVEAKKTAEAKAVREREEAKKAEATRQQKEIETKQAAETRTRREREEARKAEAARQVKEIEARKAAEAKAEREREEARKAAAARQQKEIEARKAAQAKALREEEAKKVQAAKKQRETEERQRVAEAKAMLEMEVARKAEAAKRQREIDDRRAAAQALREQEVARKKLREAEERRAADTKRADEERKKKLEALKQQQKQSLRVSSEQKKLELAQKKQEEALLASLAAAPFRATIQLLGFGGARQDDDEDDEGERARAPKPTRTTTTTTTARRAPAGVPTISRWRRNADGSISGLVSGSRNFDDGERITTSPITKGTIAPEEVVTTGSGSRYFLE